MAEKTLNLTQCKEYMKNIMELELSCYEQERLLRGLNQRINATNNRISTVKSDSARNTVKKEFSVGDFFSSLLFGGGIGAIVGGVIGAVVAIIGAIANLFPGGEWAPHLIRGAIIGGIAGFLLLLVSVKSSNKEEIGKEKERVKSIGQYENQLLALQGERDSGKQKLQETKDVLAQYYNLGFIYPKYRNLVAVATMYEYLDSRRCYSLIGPNGAYNLYESELRMNTIIGKLDDVISRLDDLAEGQQMLAREIRQSNAKIDRLNKSLGSIENNTAVAAYYSEITAQNSSIDLWLQILNA